MEILNQIQLNLDKQKYNHSMVMKYDCSGSMYYCKCCAYSKNNSCIISQKQRVTDNKCARAFRRLLYEYSRCL